MPATLSDVAKKARVTANTVSCILNQGRETDFAPETIDRVKKAAQALNYKTHSFARSLRTGRTNMIGITTIGSGTGYFDKPYSAQIYRGIANVASNHNTRMVFHHLKENGNQDHYMEMIESRTVDGVILLLLSQQVKQFRTTTMKKLQKMKVPFVIIHSLNEEVGCYAVGLDSEKAGFKAADHLIGHGYGQVGCMVREPAEAHTVNFYKGYRRALNEHGIAFNQDLQYQIEHLDLTHGYQAADRVIKKGTPLARALVVPDERPAYGMIKRFQEAGIKVPDQVAICGFGNVMVDAHTLTGLTTIKQPGVEKGEKATQFLLEMLENPEKMEQPETYIFEPELIINSSCGCINPVGS